MKVLISTALLALTSLLMGCEVLRALNDEDPRLPGTRVDLFSDEDASVPRSDVPIALPPAQT